MREARAWASAIGSARLVLSVAGFMGHRRSSRSNLPVRVKAASSVLLCISCGPIDRKPVKSLGILTCRLGRLVALRAVRSRGDVGNCQCGLPMLSVRAKPVSRPAPTRWRSKSSPLIFNVRPLIRFLSKQTSGNSPLVRLCFLSARSQLA